MENKRPLGWTTIEEAKLLVEAGLDPNTADMWISPNGKYVGDSKQTPNYNTYPCWSIGALVGLIPKGIKVNDVNFHFYMSYDNTNKWSAVFESAFFKRRLFCSVFPSQMDLLINVILWLLHNNHIKKQE